MEGENMRDLIAEFLGAFALILIGAGSILVNAGLVGIALAHGLVIFVMATSFGRVSGGHFNPAVSLAFASIGKMKMEKLVPYIVAQLLGAAAAGFVLLAIFGAAGSATNLGAPALGANVSVGAGILVEAILTFFLVTVIMNTAVFDKNNALAPLAIGMTITLDILFGGPLTGGAMNPARAFGPALAAGFWTNHVVYWVGPIVGGVAAALLTKTMNK
jgi:MIP family channel proteins